MSNMSGRSTISSALESGIEFLESRQGNDGLWRDFLTPAGEASLWPTAFIGTALHTAGVGTSALQRAAAALLAYQDSAGGWGYNENVPHDADSTACALLFLAHVECPKDARQRAVSCLLSHQLSDSGGFATFRNPDPIRQFMGVGPWMRFDGWCQPLTEVTALAARALATSGLGSGGALLHAAWQFVRTRQRADGSWTSYWWPSPHYATLQAVELALLMGADPYAQLAGDWALQSQTKDGAWDMPGEPHSAFATALCLSILVKVRADPTSIVRAARHLAGMQDADGGWPSHPILRIPLPRRVDPEKRRPWPFRNRGAGIVICDQHRTFTSAASIAALAAARSAAD
jgi:squalene-hopene/tetraprenyl-beta-curcumene cyclase